MTVKKYLEVANFNMQKGPKSFERALGISMLRFHATAISLGANDLDDWNDWESKVTPDCSELRKEILEEAEGERLEALNKHQLGIHKFLKS
jgi:hypothetical protein